MALSQNLVDQFVELTKKDNKELETTSDGVYKKINGVEYVQLDGSEILTPVKTLVEAETGERVKVLIKNHTATVTHNITSPMARSKSVENLKQEVDENGNMIQQLDNTIIQQGNTIIQLDNNINQQNNEITQINNVINQQENAITQIGNTINQQNNEIIQMNNKINQQGNDIIQVNNTISQQGNVINQQGNTINQINNNIDQQNNVIEQHGNIIQQHSNKIDQQDNEISQIGNDISQIDNTVVQQGNIIQQHDNDIQQYGNKIYEQGSNITILNSAFQIINGEIIGLSSAMIDKIKTGFLDTDYAKIDFANIGEAAVRKIFSDTGIVKDLIVESGKITGELAGVTIKGDLIQGNTIAADKLVVKGSDGLYYKLNIDGMDHIGIEEASKFVILSEEPLDWDTNYKDYYKIVQNGGKNEYVHVDEDIAPTWEINTYYKLSEDHQSGLDGSSIIAHSIVAEKIAVTDLVAFDATIGGFNITNDSIYTGKDNINSTAKGIYLGNDGQLAFGDINNFIKFFKDTDNQWKIQIKANALYESTSTKSIGEQINDVVNKVDDAVKTITNLYYASNSITPPNKPNEHITTSSGTTYEQWNLILPVYDSEHKFLYTCKEILYVDDSYDWTSVEQSSYVDSIKEDSDILNNINGDYLTRTDFVAYDTEKTNENGVMLDRIVKTELTIYGNKYVLTTSKPSDWDTNYGNYFICVNGIYRPVTQSTTIPTWEANTYYRYDETKEDEESLNSIANDAKALSETAASDANSAVQSIKNAGLDDYAGTSLVTRISDIERSVDSITDIFESTGGRNLIQNSMGFFTAMTTNLPILWYALYGSDNNWRGGTKITGTDVNAKIFSDSGITDAVVGMKYVNTSTFNTYVCTVAGDASVAKWKYAGFIKFRRKSKFSWLYNFQRSLANKKWWDFK